MRTNNRSRTARPTVKSAALILALVCLVSSIFTSNLFALSAKANGGESVLPKCGIEFDAGGKKLFRKDGDLTFGISFGVNDEAFAEQVPDISHADIYFTNHRGTKITGESYASEDGSGFKMEHSYDRELAEYRTEYSEHTEVKIPNELLSDEIGFVYVNIVFKDSSAPEAQFEIRDYALINYRIIGNRVVFFEGYYMNSYNQKAKPLFFFARLLNFFDEAGEWISGLFS